MAVNLLTFMVVKISATTFSITTLSTTLSTMDLIATLSINVEYETAERFKSPVRET
jgi:hypothetical protein